MKNFKRYFALALTCICVILQIESFAQFGETTYTKHDLKKEVDMYNKYAEECKRVQSHNEWVIKEEHRLNDGKTFGGIIILVGIGLLITGMTIRKLH